MDTGKALLATILKHPETIKDLLEARFDLSWMTDPADLSRAAIFGDDTADAYRYILRYWDEHREVPSLAYFRQSYPPEALKLPDPEMSPRELLDVASRERKRAQLEVKGSEFIDLFDEGKYDEAEKLMEDTVTLLRQQRANPSVHIALDSGAYDLEAKLHRTEARGIRTGHKKIDNAFSGFQPGQLIVYLGRSKAMKTTHAIRSAIAAHEDGYSVLFISVEITADSIADRFDCHEAGVDYNDYVRGRLTTEGEKKLRAMQSQRGEDEALHIVQPTAAYTLTDLEADIDRYDPDYVVVDGFYFLIDRNTGKSGANWEGNDNLSREIADLTLRRNITTLVTMQIREKQARTGKRGEGFDDSSIVGGTGLTMACFYMFILDYDPDTRINTMMNTRARIGYLPTLRGTWWWKYSSFEEASEDFEDDMDDEDDDERGAF